MKASPQSQNQNNQPTHHAALNELAFSLQIYPNQNLLEVSFHRKQHRTRNGYVYFCDH